MINNVQIGNNQTINIHQLNELLYANPAVRGFNAFLSQVDKKQVLHLTIDAFDHFDLLPISSRLPKDLPVAFSYGNADPFNFRMKSQIQFR